jgi:sarcosine oxidase
MSTARADVIVIGLGAMGAAATWQLARRKARVLGIEQFTPANARGSSHGETRITREFVGEGADYLPLVRRSHELWADLEALGYDLRARTGLLVMARKDRASLRHGAADFLAQTIAVGRLSGATPDLLDAADIRRRFPQFEVTDDTIACFEAQGGFVRPERCIAVQLEQATATGQAELHTNERVLALRQVAGAVEVTTDRSRYVAPRVVLATGAWTPGLAGGPFAASLVIHRQTLFWFATLAGAAWDERSAPAFLWFHGDGADDVFYGFPQVSGGRPGVKVATEQYLTACDPDAPAPRVSPAEAAQMFHRHVAGRMRGVTSRFVDGLTCLYAYNAADPGRFMIGPHPHVAGVTVISACSGHGFKHSAAIGESVAQSIVGETPTCSLEAFAIPA